MTLLSYIDVRPLLFVAGLILFIGFALLVCRLTKARFKKWKVSLVSALIFNGAFTVLLTGFGPLVEQKEIREYMMNWEVKPAGLNGMKEAEVVLSFVDFPGYYIGEYSDILSAHLRSRGDQPVKVVFEITSDYGMVRGFNGTEIAGLRDWKSEWSYAATEGSPAKSPWN